MTFSLPDVEAACHAANADAALQEEIAEWQAFEDDVEASDTMEPNAGGNRD